MGARGRGQILGHALSGGRSFPRVVLAVCPSVSSRSPLPACSMARPPFAVRGTGLRRHLIILTCGHSLLSTLSVVCCLFPSFIHLPVELSFVPGANPAGRLLVCGSLLFIASLDKQKLLICQPFKVYALPPLKIPFVLPGNTI